MSRKGTTEIFFRLPECKRESWVMPAPIYRQCRRLLRRSEYGCRFIPIRNMQYQAVIDATEIIFVDSQGGHVVHDGKGGRPILLSWQPLAPSELESLSQPVPCTVVHYQPVLDAIQRRLVGEFDRALALASARLLAQKSVCQSIVISLQSAASNNPKEDS